VASWGQPQGHRSKVREILDLTYTLAQGRLGIQLDRIFSCTNSILNCLLKPSNDESSAEACSVVDCLEDVNSCCHEIDVKL
jgi:hypothetical protein